jgi:membrane-associated protein
MAVFAGALEWLLSVPDWAALVLIFLFPALEASALLGVFVPGEAAIVIGGALASQGRVSLAGAMIAAVLGAIVGDSIGYSVGKRWGHKTVPKNPRRRKQLEKGERLLRRHPGWTITLGRFPPGLRTIVPGLAGLSRVPYRSFVLYNVIGAAVWGCTFVLLGYEAGLNWRQAEKLVSASGLALVGALVLGYLAYRSYRRGWLAQLRNARSA